MYAAQEFGWVTGDLDDETCRLWNVTEIEYNSRSWGVFAHTEEEALRISRALNYDEDLSHVEQAFESADISVNGSPESDAYAADVRMAARAARAAAVARRSSARAETVAQLEETLGDGGLEAERASRAREHSADGRTDFVVYVEHTRYDRVIVSATTAEEAYALAMAYDVADLAYGKNYEHTWAVEVEGHPTAGCPEEVDNVED